MGQSTHGQIFKAFTWVIFVHFLSINVARAAETPPFELVGKQRTVPELVQLMKAHRPTPAQLEKEQLIADSLPPAKLEGDRLADFYVQRALAARSLARVEQSSADLKLAIDAFGSAYSNAKMHAIHLLTQSNFNCVSDRPENDNTAEVLRDSPDGNTAYSLPRKIRYAVNKGDLPAAEIALNELSNYLANLRPDQYNSRIYTEENIAFGNYLIARTKGKFPQAGDHLQESVRISSEIVQRLEKVTQNDLGRKGIQAQLLGFRSQLLMRRQLLANLLVGRNLLEAEWESTNSLIESLQNPSIFWNGVPESAITLAEVLSMQGRHENAKMLVNESLSVAKANKRENCRYTFQGSNIDIEAAIYNGDFQVAADLTRNNLKQIDIKNYGPPVNRRLELWIVALLLDHDDVHAKIVIEGAIRKLDAAKIGNIPERARYEFYEALVGSKGLPIQEQIERLGGYVYGGIARQVLNIGFADKRNESYKQRLRFILDYYLDLLLQLEPTQARNAQALEIAQWITSINQPNGLVANLTRDANVASERHELTRRIQDARLESEAYQHAANNLAGEANSSSKNRAQVLKIEAENSLAKRNTLLQDYRTKFNSAQTLERDRTRPHAAAIGALKPSEAMLIYKSHADHTDIWFIKPGNETEWKRLSLSKKNLQALVAKVRDSVDPNQWVSSSPAKFAVDEALALHQYLIAPFAKNLEGSEKIVVVTDDALSSLPFELLVESASADNQNMGYQNMPWLVKKYAFSYLPSVESFVELRARAKPTFTRQFVGIGDPIFGTNVASIGASNFRQGFVGGRSSTNSNGETMLPSDLPALPDTGIELTAISKVFKLPLEGNVFLQANANKVLAKSGVLESTKIISFATHGLNSGDVPGLFEPALALSAQPQDKLDNLLRASEISQLKLNADWVVLSACNSASVSATSKSTINGLADAFFYAGARALLITHWAVDSTAARDLMISTFENYLAGGEQDKSGSLRKAMLSMMKDENRAHPFFWAPFAVHGD
jgi:CHAT domain-containing protein